MKTGLSLPSCSWLPISANGPQSTAASRRPCKSFSSSQVDCKVEMGWFISFTTGLITGKITTNLKLKNLDLFLKFKSVTSVQVVLSCCSTLGRHCFIRQEDWDCRKNRDFFSSFHKPVSNLECSKPLFSDYNSSPFMKLLQIPFGPPQTWLMEELNCLLCVRQKVDGCR